MKSKMKKRSLICGVSMALFVSFAVGCTSNPAKPSTNESVAEVWSTYSTAKIVKSSDKNETYKHGDAKIDVKLMKNETEGAQLIVSADRDIKNYNLITTDLTDGNGHTLSKSSISVYAQKYHKLTSKRTTENTAFSIGDYIPDMLLPLDIAIAYGENTIESGNNQGLTIEFTTSSDTAPGTYTGNFVLSLDNEEKNIPVCVEVWDIEYTGKRTMQSSFLVYQNQIMSGEYDNSDEVIQQYSDLLVKYKANALIWTGDTSCSDLDAWMTEQKRLFKDDNYNSIYIPYYFTTSYTTYDNGGNLTANAQKAFEHFDTIVNASMEKDEEGKYTNYVDYAYMYVIHLDEADINSTRAAAAEKVFSEINKTYAAYLEHLQTEENFTELKETNPEYAQEVLDAVGNITTLFVNVGYIDYWVGTMDCTFCTYVSTLAEGYVVDRYEEAAKEYSNGDLWTYVANNSLYPTPSFLTDDYVLGMRVAGWMEKAYNVTGFLYWNASYYRVNGDAEIYLDVYEDLDRASYISGDGFLLYPGRYYGSSSPFASLRLTAYRDSMDDYDMLCVYENLLNEYAEEYNVEIDFDSYVEDLYWSLFKGADYNTADEALFAAREELARRILAIQNDDKLLISSGKDAQSGRTLNIYAQSFTLEIDGQTKTGTASGSGYAYSFNLRDNSYDLVIKSATHTYTYTLSGATTKASLSTDTVSVTQDSSVACEEGKAQVTMRSVYRNDTETIDGATLRYRLSVSVQYAGVADADNLCFTIKNTGADGFDARVEVMVGSTSYTLGTFYCAAGASRDLKFHIYDSLNIDVSKITAVNISFANVKTDSDGVQTLFGDRSFELSEVYFEKK